MKKNIFKNLTLSQKKAVECSDSLSIIAGPGSGKTRVAAARALNFLVQGNRVLCLTFSVKAAKEMESRIQDYCQGIDNFKKNAKITVKVSTVHSLAFNILKDSPINLSSYKEWTALADSFIKIKIADSNEKPKRFLTSFWQKINQQTLELPENSIYKDFDLFRKENKLHDFDDLIIEAIQVLDNFFENNLKCPDFDHLIVDEFQDLSKLDFKFIGLLFNFKKAQLKLTDTGVKNQKSTICVIGDPNQSIYDFKGADPDIFTLFHNTFTAESIKLMECFRCPENIINAANAFISDSDDYATNCKSDSSIDSNIESSIESSNTLTTKSNNFFDKPMTIIDKPMTIIDKPMTIIDKPMTIIDKPITIIVKDRPSIIKNYVINRVETLFQGVSLDSQYNHDITDTITENLDVSDIAILARTKHELLHLKKALQEKGLPCFGSTDKPLFSQKWCKKILILTLITSLLSRECPKNKSQRTIGNIFKKTPFEISEITETVCMIKGIKTKNAEAFINALLNSAKKADILMVLKNTSLDLFDFVVSNKLLDNLPDLMERSAHFLKSHNALTSGDYNILKLLCQGLSTDGILNFIIDLHKDSLDDASIVKKGINLLTIHAAKGLEFKEVFIIYPGFPDFPSHRSDLKSEKRLFYVAMTRAQSNLHILDSGVTNSLNKKSIDKDSCLNIKNQNDFIKRIPRNLKINYNTKEIQKKLQNRQKWAKKKNSEKKQMSLF